MTIKPFCLPLKLTDTIDRFRTDLAVAGRKAA
jgi:hypothetical protein